MVNNQYRISFEVEDNWNIEGFRNFVKYLLSDDKFDVFIISNADSSSYIDGIASQLGLPENRVFITNFTDDKVQTIQDQLIDIHFDNLQSVILLVDNTTDAYGILVTHNLNKFYLEPDYIITFERILKFITDENSEQG